MESGSYQSQWPGDQAFPGQEPADSLVDEFFLLSRVGQGRLPGKCLEVAVPDLDLNALGMKFSLPQLAGQFFSLFPEALADPLTILSILVKGGFTAHGLDHIALLDATMIHTHGQFLNLFQVI